MAVPSVFVSGNAGGAVTTFSPTVSLAVPAGTEVVIGIGASSDAATVNSVADSKSNEYLLVGHAADGANQPVWIYKGAIKTGLTTSDTVTVTSSSTVLNVIGAALPGCVGTETFFHAEGNSQTAALTDAPVGNSNEYVLAFEHNGTNSPSWSAPATILGSVLSGGSGGFFTASYTLVTDMVSGASPTATIPTSAVPWQIASVGTFTQYTDFYTDAYTALYGVFTGNNFPASPIKTKVEILINGVWTDVKNYVYQRDGSTNIQITRGRPDESQNINPAKCVLQFNNRDGSFSPKNTAGQFYPFLTRNTELRVSAQASATGEALSYRFWGEVSAWPVSWDITGNDVWVTVTASGITRRLSQGAKIGSAMFRYYNLKDPSDPTFPVAYWPCEDGQFATQLYEVTGGGSTAMTITGSPTLASNTSFTGSDALPVVNNSSWVGLTGSYAPAGDVLYTKPGTYKWTAPAGVTSADVICVASGGGGSVLPTAGSGGGGGGEYAEETALAVTPGKTYTFTVPSGGSGASWATGALSSDGSDCTFPGDSVTVHAHKGLRGTQTAHGNGGSGSTNTVHHSGGNGFYSSTVAGGGGSSGDQTTAGNNATSATGALPSGNYGGVGGDGVGTVSGGGGGGGGGGVQNFTKTYTCTHSYSYEGSDGTFANAKINTDTNPQQGGDVANTFNGKSKSWLLFDHATIASDLSGATITKVTLTIDCNHSWYDAGGTMALGWDTKSSFGSTASDPSSHVDLKEFSVVAGNVYTFNIGTAFGTAFQSSGATTLVLFKNTNDLHYYCIFNGPNQSNPPKLTISYQK